jgi:hypothetical protein
MRKIKYFKIYKNLKDSFYFTQLAEEIKNIKRRYLINQIGGARFSNRSFLGQNQVLNDPVSSGTRSRSSAAAASVGNDNSRNRGNRGNRGNSDNPVNPIINGNYALHSKTFMQIDFIACISQLFYS